MSISKGAPVLVTGASGAVGPCVVDALCSAGHVVRTFSLDRPHDARQTPLRSGSFHRRQGYGGQDGGQAIDDERWPSDVETCIGDVTDPAAVQSAIIVRVDGPIGS